MYQNFVFQESSKSAKVGKSGGQENAEHEVGLSVSQSNNIRHFPEHTGSVLCLTHVQMPYCIIIVRVGSHYQRVNESLHPICAISTWQSLR